MWKEIKGKMEEIIPEEPKKDFSGVKGTEQEKGRW